MVEHIPSLYTKKPTLQELYTAEPELFDEMELPEDFSTDTVGAYIVQKWGSLETIFPTAAEAAGAIKLWSLTRVNAWDRMWAALQADYEPLENYSMLETMTDDTTVREYGKTTTRTPNLTHGKSGTETTTPNLTETETPNTTDTTDSSRVLAMPSRK